VNTVLTIRARLLLATFGLTLIALIATARTLKPDPRGYGTHEQLRLATCGFTRLTGWRCPTCGMTTSWAHAARGDFRSAVAASGGGTALLALVAPAACWAVASAVGGRMIGGRPSGSVLLLVGGAVLAVTVLDWVRRIATG
jgi:hypothetical protein